MWYTLAFTQSGLVILLRFRGVIERSKTFFFSSVACLQHGPRKTMKGVQQRKENSFCSAACVCQNTENSVTLRVIPPRQMCCSNPKMRAMCQGCSQKNSYISETATKHKDVNTSKENLRNVHLLLHYVYMTVVWWLKLCRISSYILHWRWTCKLWIMTFGITYQRNVILSTLLTDLLSLALNL